MADKKVRKLYYGLNKQRNDQGRYKPNYFVVRRAYSPRHTWLALGDEITLTTMDKDGVSNYPGEVIAILDRKLAVICVRYDPNAKVEGGPPLEDTVVVTVGGAGGMPSGPTTPPPPPLDDPTDDDD